MWSEVDLDAIRENVGALRELARPAEFLAVVKANAYGHGAVPGRAAPRSRPARRGSASRASRKECSCATPASLRRSCCSRSPRRARPRWWSAHGLTPVVYTVAGIDALAKAVADSGRATPLAVHLKVDTGMHRVGSTTDDAPALAEHVTARDELVLAGICTHLALADEPADPYTDEQLARFDALLQVLAARGLRPPLTHAANSAGLLASPPARYDLVRVGIACYGLPPAPALAGHAGVTLRPALSLRARVTMVKELPAGARVSYGLRYELARPGRVATVPAGYADGVPRNLGLVGGEVLIGGRRHPIAGMVTMDQLMVDLGDAPADAGDEVVLIGRQGDQEVTATEWAQRLGTISYEIVTGIGARVPRTYRGAS